MSDNGSLLGRLVIWTIIGILAVIALKIALSILGFAFGIATFLLFTIGPVLLVGWLIMKAWRAFTEPA